jgi:hypothetical protein
LRSLLTILIAFSLYAPSVAKILAYADCTIVVLSNNESELCDCTKFIDAASIPLSNEESHQQKQLAFKTDWKYILSNNPLFCTGFTPISPKISKLSFLRFPSPFLKSIFRPPMC